jgi:hypothetical protein
VSASGTGRFRRRRRVRCPRTVSRALEAKLWKEPVDRLGGCRCTRWRDLDQELEAWTGWTY